MLRLICWQRFLRYPFGCFKIKSINYCLMKSKHDSWLIFSMTETWFSIARRPIRTNCTTGVRTYFCKSTECPESWSSIAAAIAQVGFLSRRRQSKLCTSSAHFLVIRSRIYGHQVAMIPLRSWRFFVVPQTRFFLFHPTLPASPSFRASKARLEI